MTHITAIRDALESVLKGNDWIVIDQITAALASLDAVEREVNELQAKKFEQERYESAAKTFGVHSTLEDKILDALKSELAAHTKAMET